MEESKIFRIDISKLIKSDKKQIVMNRASIATSTSEQNSSRAVSSMGWMQESGPFF